MQKKLIAKLLMITMIIAGFVVMNATSASAAGSSGIAQSNVTISLFQQTDGTYLSTAMQYDPTSTDPYWPYSPCDFDSCGGIIQSHGVFTLSLPKGEKVVYSGEVCYSAKNYLHSWCDNWNGTSSFPRTIDLTITPPHGTSVTYHEHANYATVSVYKKGAPVQTFPTG